MTLDEKQSSTEHSATKQVKVTPAEFPTLQKYIERYNSITNTVVREIEKPKTLETEIDMYTRGIAHTIQLIKTNGIDSIVFMDKSARPAALMLFLVWGELYPDEPFPKSTYLNASPRPEIPLLNWRYTEKESGVLKIGKILPETDSWEKYKDVFKDTKIRLNKALKEPRRILIVDEVSSSGKTLVHGSFLTKKLFPQAQVIPTEIFEQSPVFAMEEGLTPIREIGHAKLAEKKPTSTGVVRVERKSKDINIKEALETEEELKVRKKLNPWFTQRWENWEKDRDLQRISQQQNSAAVIKKNRAIHTEIQKEHEEMFLPFVKDLGKTAEVIANRLQDLEISEDPVQPNLPKKLDPKVIDFLTNINTIN